ncbi:MAG: STAS domain-containing protein [Bacteroidales bacterium]|nr:STAS domain-containing protein [Bacteroidales bacterium]
MMLLTIKKHSSYSIIEAPERVDTLLAADFEMALLDAGTHEDSNMVIDCSKLVYLSSSGLRVFLLVQKKMLAKGVKLRLCHLRPSIQELFDISGFSTIFPIFADLKTAITEIVNSDDLLL